MVAKIKKLFTIANIAIVIAARNAIINTKNIKKKQIIIYLFK
jgi:hypothetical protein